MKILAIDLGKFKCVACDYAHPSGEHAFESLPTTPQAVHDLIAARAPDRLVIEIGSAAGWIRDLAESLDLEIQIANPSHEAWRWKGVKRKTDRDDALKLAKLSAMNQLPLVNLPARRVRQWRSLISYRHTLVSRRTQVCNSIRALLDRQGLSWPSGRSGWTSRAMARLRAMSRSFDQLDPDELWRYQLKIEIDQWEALRDSIAELESALNGLAQSDDRVRRLQTIPGVGPRLSELLVAIIDDPHRFDNARQVGAYAGLVPKQFESGQMQRQGRISRSGPGLLRKLLVEVAWLMRRYNAHGASIFAHLSRGQKTRRKIAAVGLARRLLIWSWAMLRDGTDWDPQRVVART